MNNWNFSKNHEFILAGELNVFEPIDIDIFVGKYALILLGNSLGFADPIAVTTDK